MLVKGAIGIKSVNILIEIILRPFKSPLRICVVPDFGHPCTVYSPTPNDTGLSASNVWQK